MNGGLPVPKTLKLVVGIPWFVAVCIAPLFPWLLIAISCIQMAEFLGAPEPGDAERDRS